MFDRKVSMDRAEYEALVEVRDGALQRAQLSAKAHEENYRACLKINEAQCARLASQDLLLTDLHAKIATHERETSRLRVDQGAADKLAAAEKRVRDLEAELAYYKPATSSVPQPAIGRRT